MEEWDEEIDSDEYSSDDDESSMRVYPWYYLDMPSHVALALSGGVQFYNLREERAWRMSSFLSSVRLLYPPIIAYKLADMIRLYLYRCTEASLSLDDFDIYLRRYMDYVLYHGNIR